MEIEVSNGELLDKITILKIKTENIFDKEKLKNVERELEYLYTKSRGWWYYWHDELLELYSELFSVNRKLWDIEDKIRELDSEVFPLEQYGEHSSVPFVPYFFLPEKVCEYMECARMVYTLNDRRSAIKKEINIITQSNIVEEKSHK